MSYYNERVYAKRPAVPGHSYADLSRYSRGMTPIRPARPLYGWRWTCECGADGRVNGPKSEGVSFWRDHRLPTPQQQEG